MKKVEGSPVSHLEQQLVGEPLHPPHHLLHPAGREPFVNESPKSSVVGRMTSSMFPSSAWSERKNPGSRVIPIRLRSLRLSLKSRSSLRARFTSS